MQVMDGDWQLPFSIPIDCSIRSFLKHSHVRRDVSWPQRKGHVPAGEWWIMESAVKTSLRDVVLRPTIYRVKYQLFRSADKILTNVASVGQTQGN